MRTRNVNAELIRVMACLIVIGVHCNLLTTSADSSQTLWRVMLSDGVTYYLILMGFFLFRKKPFFQLLKNVILRIMLPGLVVMLFIRLLYPWIHNECSLWQCFTLLQFDYREYIRAIINWSPGGYGSEYLWYLFTYMQIVMLVPVMRFFCKEETYGHTCEKVRFYVIGINLLGMILRDAMALIRIPFTAEPYTVLTVPAMMSIAGYTIYVKREQLKGNRMIRRISLGLAIIIEAIRWRLQIILLTSDMSNTNYLGWHTGFAFLVAVCVVIFIMTLRLECEWVKRGLVFVGKKTFLIYLIHYPIQCFLDARGFGDVVMKMFSKPSGTIGNFGELAFILTRILVIFLIAFLFSLIPNGYHICRNVLRRDK